MISETFSDGDSPIHRLDPRVKLIGAALISIAVSLCETFEPLLLSLAFSMFLCTLARLSPIAVGLRLLLVNGFNAFLWFVLPFTVAGSELWRFGSLSLSLEGLQLALLITLKSNSIILLMMALPATSTLVNLSHALHHLWVPTKLVYLFSFTVRYLDLIAREYGRLRRAMKVRGFRPGNNLHTYRSYAYLVAMLLVRSTERSERIYQAMLCRGFSGTLHTLNHFEFGRFDVAALCSFVAVSTALLLL